MLELDSNASVFEAGEWQLQVNTLQFTCQPFPEQIMFIEWATQKLSLLGAQISDVANGIERAQVHFVYSESAYILCFEETCEAIWIEGIGEQGQQDFAALSKELSTVS